MTTLYDLVPRDGWESGPWDGEPDRVEWVDGVTGYPCLIVRHFLLGYLCGYVAVPPEHPLHGASWQENDTLRAIEVHNGVTYSEPCHEAPPPGTDAGPPELYVCHVPEPGAPDDVWWLGFHCGGYRDRQPRMEAEMRRVIGRAPSDYFPPGHPMLPRYWPLGYVRGEVTRLAAQLLAAQLAERATRERHWS